VDLAERMAWESFAEQFRPKPRRWPSPLDMACQLDPTTVRTPALEEINRQLVALADEVAEDRLMVFMPPQEGKSTLCSKWYPLWRLIGDPDRRIAVVSYSDEMARRWGADIKQLVEMHNGTDGSIDLGIRLREDSRAAGRWQVRGRLGGVYCVGIAGSLTGKPVDELVIDDPVKDLSAAQSEALRRRAHTSGRAPRYPGSARGRSACSSRPGGMRKTWPAGCSPKRVRATGPRADAGTSCPSPRSPTPRTTRSAGPSARR
jgi:hypothetical protein